MNKYDKAVLARLEKLCADGGLEYRHPDPNDSELFNAALEYYTDAGRSDCATLLTGAVVPVKFDEAEKQVKAGSRRDSANELGERVVLKDDSLGRRRLNNKTMILAGLAAGTVLVLFVVWKNAFSFQSSAKPVVVAAPSGGSVATPGVQGGTASTSGQSATPGLPTKVTAVTPGTGTSQGTSAGTGATTAALTSAAPSGSEPTQPVAVPQRPYTQPYVQQAPAQVPTPPTFQQTPVASPQPVPVTSRSQGQQYPVQVPVAPVSALPMNATSVPSVSQTPAVSPFRLVPRTLTPPVTVRAPVAVRAAGALPVKADQAPANPGHTDGGAGAVPAQQVPAVVYSRPGSEPVAGGSQATVYARPGGADTSANGAHATVYTKVSATGGGLGAGQGTSTVYNRGGGLSDLASAAGSALVAYRSAATPTAVSADAGAAQQLVYQRAKVAGSAGATADAPPTTQGVKGTVQPAAGTGVSGLTPGLNALSGGAAVPQVPGAASVASLASGSTSTVQNPYRKGQRLKAKLLTGFATANGASVPVLAQSEDGVTWIGTGTLINNTLVQIDFRTAVLADGKELDVTASAFSNDGYPGVEAQVTDTNPTLLTDILRGAASGASDYVTGLVNAGTNVVLPSGGVITSKASASLGDNILGAVGSLFKIPNVSSNFVRVARLSQDTAIQIVYGVSNSGR